MELAKNHPSVVKNILLLSPGIWNDTEYSAEEIVKAYQNTNWSDKKNTNLFLDHQDTKERGVGNWAGYVKNLKLVNSSELWGDLEIWNPVVATYIKEAKAPFGISATLAGIESPAELEGAKSRMNDFHYQSFSIVTDPACKEATINLSVNQSNSIKTVTLGKINSEEIEDDEEEKDDEDDLDLDNELAKKKSKEYNTHNEESVSDSKLIECKEVNKMEEEAKKLEEVKVEENAFDKEKKKKKMPEEEMPEEKMMSEKSDFDKLSEQVLALAKGLEELKSLMAPKVPEADESAEELANVKKELSELREEFGRPDRKTLSVSTEDSHFVGDANEGMLSFLQGRLN